MLVYQCKNCGQLTIGGMINEFEEHFCKEQCYIEYCKKHNYNIHPENLSLVNMQVCIQNKK